jgi:hypothetical protein
MGCLLAVLVTSLLPASAAPKNAAPEIQLSETGKRAETRYAADLAALQAEIAKALPVVSEQKRAVLQQAQESLKKAEAELEAARKPLDAVKAAEGLVGHAKGKWIGGADKGIASAEAALKKAATAAERAAAEKDLAHWRSNRVDGVKALNERQAALDKAKLEAPKATQMFQAAEAALATARSNELAAVKALLAVAEPFVSGDRYDAKLVRAAVLAEATPKGLAAFAQQGTEQEKLVEKLLAEPGLMQEMLVAGGASGGQYGRAMQIYFDIRRASPKSGEGALHRLALATSLEHAVPVAQSNPASQTNGPAFVDPVKRYLHYEKAFLGGELDAAFQSFTTWEYRMIVDCDAPDAILAWGREMLRTYRPDHVTNPDYGWRYSGAVRTDVTYGSQNVKDDLPSLHSYQNIPKNGGVCGRRAFFGRFILKSFGIPVWGVTQHKHAALSHWTPKGWVVNLGAGFPHSWWDKDDAPRSGSDFLLESQAREDAAGYLKVLRAQWVGRVLGEEAFNDRKKVAGGLWSNLAHHQAVLLAARAVELGPLGQELGEANESSAQQIKLTAPAPALETQTASVRDGAIVIPAASAGKSTGSKAVMDSFSGGAQLHAGGGFKTQFTFDAPQSGLYALTAQVATLQDGQVFLFAANDAKAPVEAAVPYTVGLWQKTAPVQVALNKGGNSLNFEVTTGSRGVTIKEFTLTPLR